MNTIILFAASFMCICLFFVGIICKAVVATFEALLTTFETVFHILSWLVYGTIGISIIYMIMAEVSQITMSETLKNILLVVCQFIILIIFWKIIGRHILGFLPNILYFILNIIYGILETISETSENWYGYFLRIIANKIEKY